MSDKSSERITSPKAVKIEILRKELVNVILHNSLSHTYIQGGAGYGKTTLLSQLSTYIPNTIWLSLKGESDVFTFVNDLCEAIRLRFPHFDFILPEYFAFEEKESLLAKELIASIEKIAEDFTIIMDDLQTIKNGSVRALIAYFIKYIPINIKLILSSREAPWKELLPVCTKERFLELRQYNLSFTRDETSQILGLDSEYIYKITEGWPLAVISCKLLMENGISLDEIPSHDNEALYSYLFYECISRLPQEVHDFLKSSAALDELDPGMLNYVLGKSNSGIILENLVYRNLFISKIANGLYQYHALFKKYLLKDADNAHNLILLEKASLYYIEKHDFNKAAEYAIRIQDKELLQTIIIACYKEYMRAGNYNELRIWFKALGNNLSLENANIFVAKGAYLSSIGNFTAAKACLDSALPMLNDDNNELYIEAMIHKARVYRNYISFEESNVLLDKLIEKLDSPASELAYDVIIEKLYNLCWNSQINEAYNLAEQCIEACTKAGNFKVLEWYKRYLSAIYFFMGRMKETIQYYENSLKLPNSELLYLDMHGIGIYAAKAYQMLGNRSRSLSLLSDELQKLKSTGKFEEMWFGYLFAAEIHYQNTFIDNINGENVNYEITKHYFDLANEYAPLYRKTDFQMQWVKMLQLTYSLVFSSSAKDDTIKEIFVNLDKSSDYLKCIILARLYGYYALISDYHNAVMCAKLCIEAGEKSNMQLHSTLAYGILARATLSLGNMQAAEYLIKKYMYLCHELGIYEYFKMRKGYDSIIKFAFNKCIEPDATRYIMEFAGYKVKKAYIQTLGGLAVFPYDDRKTPIKTRTKKERELLTFLIEAGKQGVTKEKIYSAIWSESESDNIKKLIGVNLSQLKKDLTILGLNEAVICKEKRYIISMDEIECDFELFEAAASRFELNPNRDEALKLISLYTGEYLSDLEALWAISKRIKYRNIYEEAVSYVHN